MTSEYLCTTIGEVCSVGDGAHTKVTRQNFGVPYLTSKNIGSGFLKLDNVDFISEEDFEKLFPKNSKATRRLKPGDVLIGIIGTFGNAYRYKESDHFGVSSSVAILRPNQSVLNPDFFFYVVTSNSFKQAHLGYKSGSVQGYTNIPTIKCLPIPLPLLEEQKAIAHILGTLDDKIELNQQMNRNLEAIAQAIFKSWFVDFDLVRAKMEGRQPAGMDAATAALFPNSFEDSPLGEFPKGWQVVLLPQVAEVIDCLHSKKPSDLGQGKLLLQVWNIADAGKLDLSKKYLISEEDYKRWTSRIEVQEGDCVITNVGRVGAVAQIPQDIRAAIGRNMTAIRCKPGCLTPTYLVEYLLSPAMRAEIDLNTDSGTILDSLNVKGIEQLRLVIPPTPIMNVFEHKARPLRRHIELNIEQSNSLAGIRDTLLPKLMSGEIQVKEAEKILEDVA